MGNDPQEHALLPGGGEREWRGLGPHRLGAGYLGGASPETGLCPSPSATVPPHPHSHLAREGTVPQHPPQHHLALTSAFPSLTIAPAGRPYKGDFCQYWDRSPPRPRPAPSTPAHTPVNSARAQVLGDQGLEPRCLALLLAPPHPWPPPPRCLGGCPWTSLRRRSAQPRGAWAAAPGRAPDGGALPGAAATPGRNRAGIWVPRSRHLGNTVAAPPAFLGPKDAAFSPLGGDVRGGWGVHCLAPMALEAPRRESPGAVERPRGRGRDNGEQRIPRAGRGKERTSPFRCSQKRCASRPLLWLPLNPRRLASSFAQGSHHPPAETNTCVSPKNGLVWTRVHELAMIVRAEK